MLPDNFDAIDKPAIDALLANEVSESRGLDYKEALYGNSSSERKKLLIDITAMANSGGGDLVFGVVEKREGQQKMGIPEAIPGLAGFSLDETARNWESALRNCVQPRLNGIQFKEVAGFENGPVLVLRVPAGLDGPYMVRHDGHIYFYSRTSAGNYALDDIHELRKVFSDSASIFERLKQFREGRLTHLVVGDGLGGVGTNATTVLHVAPLSAWRNPASLDPVQLKKDRNPLLPLNFRHTSARTNLDGLLVTNEVSGKTTKLVGYVQLFRNGIIEATDTLGFINDERGKVLVGEGTVNELRGALERFLGAYRAWDINPPYVVMLSLLNVQGFHLYLGNSFYDPVSQNPADRAIVRLPEIVLDDPESEAAPALKQLVDWLWQSFGIDQCPFLNENGFWVHR